MCLPVLKFTHRQDNHLGKKSNDQHVYVKLDALHCLSTCIKSTLEGTNELNEDTIRK